MSKYLISSIACIISLVIVSCKQDPSSINGKSITSIKKEVIYTADGDKVDLGGDSIMKVFYFIKHAETDSQKVDPSLNEKGLARAAKLSGLLRKTYLDAVYTPISSRTLQTADSITQYKGLSNSIYTNNNAKEKFNELLKSPYKTRVLFICQSATMTPFVNYVYGKQHFKNVIPADQFDNLVVVVQQRDSSKQIYELKY
jgi:hypothetical protein